MIASMFADQKEILTVSMNDLTKPENKIALTYISKRDELVANLFRLGRKFKQR